MINYMIPRLENVIELLKKDLRLIASKNKDDFWKREHYCYAFTLSAQWMFDLLNSQLTEKELPPFSASTKKELAALSDQLKAMIEK